MKNNVIKYIFIFIALIFNTVSANANSEFNNELTRLDLTPAFDGVVKVNIYTNSPYSEKIVVNKKPDNKYVILLPETSNSMNSKPDLSSVGSMIRDIEVKTQPYSSLPGKGYTKITFTSKMPIEIVPQSYTSNLPKITKQTTTHVMPSPRRTTATKPILSPQQVTTAMPQRVLQQKPKSEAVTKEAFSQPQQQETITQKPQVQQRTEVSREVQHEIQREVQRNIQNEEQQIVQSEETSQEQLAVETEILEDEQNILNQAVDEATQKTTLEEPEESDLYLIKKGLASIKNKIIRKIKKIFSFKFDLSSGITIVQLILLIVLIKVICNLIKKVNEAGASAPQAHSNRLIHDEETFDNAYPSYSNMDVYNTNKNSFTEDNNQGFKTQKLQSDNFNKKATGLYSNESFYKPLSEINEEEKMSIFDENDIDIEKTIFKNPLTQLSKEEEMKIFDEEEPFEAAMSNTPFNNNLQEKEQFFSFKDNSNASDEDFFIFEENDEEDYEEDIEEDYSDDEEEEEYVEEDYSDEDEEYDEEYEDAEDEETYEEETSKPESSKNPLDELNVISNYLIDNKKGFSIVSVGDVTALIGYINSKIFILKRFNTAVKEALQVRLNEKPDENKSVYIVKIGSYKALVEVTPERIRQLLDL